MREIRKTLSVPVRVAVKEKEQIVLSETIVLLFIDEVEGIIMSHFEWGGRRFNAMMTCDPELTKEQIYNSLKRRMANSIKNSTPFCIASVGLC